MLIVYAPIIIAFLYVLVLRDEGYSQVSLPKPAQQLTLNQGDALAFVLDAGDPVWSVNGAITITGLRRPN